MSARISCRKIKLKDDSMKMTYLSCNLKKNLKGIESDSLIPIFFPPDGVNL